MGEMNGIEVFRANKSNIALVAGMIYDYYQEEKSIDSREIGVEKGRLTSAILQKLSDPKRHFYYLFSKNEKVVGLVQFAIWDPKVAGFILIYLLPEYRSQGLGKAFIAWTVNKMKSLGVKTARTEIRNGNSASMRLFSRYDLKPSSTTYSFKI